MSFFGDGDENRRRFRSIVIPKRLSSLRFPYNGSIELEALLHRQTRRHGVDPMKINRRNALKLIGGAIATESLPTATFARTYPTRPVRIVAGFPRDGAIDIAARLISPWLSARLGQPFTVDNIAGESGNIATATVVREAADGHTLLLCGPVNTINTTFCHGTLDFDFSRDIAAVAGLYRVPLLVVVHPDGPARTASEFLTYAKNNPGKLKVAYAGKGTPQHIGIELFKLMAGVDLTLMPYPGSTPALADLLAGQVQVMFDPAPSSIGHVRNGKLIALAVTAPSAILALPKVPPMNHFVSGYEAGSWFGIGAPRATPADIIESLNTEVNAALADATIQTRLAELVGTPMSGTPHDFAAFIASETDRYAKGIRAANITR
jgi:tripartite-type tricarboxylate transporter receptor subunit TctC